MTRSFELNRSLVESAQRSLGRMSLADRATALIQSATYAAELERFFGVLASRPGSAAAVRAQSTATICRAFASPASTPMPASTSISAQLARIAQALVDDQWVIGSSGEQGGFDQELLKLGPELLDRYGKGFAAAWNEVLDRLKFKAMAADKPQYLALSAVGSPTSPLMQLFEAIARETALTQERNPAGPSVKTAIRKPPTRAKGLARIGIELAARKSQSRAGTAFVSTQSQDPGRQHRSPVQVFPGLGEPVPPGQRPLDALTQNFREIYQSVRLAADVPVTDGTGQRQSAAADIDASRQCLAAAEGAGQDGQCGGGRFRRHRRRNIGRASQRDAGRDGRPSVRRGDCRAAFPSPRPAPTMSPWRISPDCSLRAGCSTGSSRKTWHRWST